MEKTGQGGSGVQADERVAPGLYKHYKGKPYEVLWVAKHSETLEQMVVYRALYGEGDVWVRPLSMFVESVMVGGALVRRFARVDPGAAGSGA